MGKSKPAPPIQPQTAPDGREYLTGDQIPEFVLSLVATRVEVPRTDGEAGLQSYAIHLGAPRLKDFNRLIKKSLRTGNYRTELQHLFQAVQEVHDKYMEMPEEDRELWRNQL